MKVLKIVQEDVDQKVDTDYILDQFSHIDRVAIFYICVMDEQEEDDWVDEDGRNIVIVLPYKKVKRMDDIRPLMLEKAKERLGLVV